MRIFAFTFLYVLAFFITCISSSVLNGSDDFVLNYVAQKRKIEKKNLVVAKKVKIDLDKNAASDFAYVFDINKTSSSERLLVLSKDGDKIEIFDKILPSTKSGLQNNIIISNEKNDLTISIELVIARPTSYDYLSFSVHEEKLLLDTIAYYFRDYENHDNNTPFSIRGDFKDKSDFGTISINELDILDEEDEEKNFYTDVSKFNFEEIKYDESEKRFKSLLTNISAKNKIKDNDWILNNVNQKEILKHYLQVPVQSSTVNDYNNLGYYLEQAGNFKMASFLLNKVIQKFPDRTVAYINLGDAYWGLKNLPKAKEAYKKYLDLMKKSGKEAKIPQKVLERVK